MQKRLHMMVIAYQEGWQAHRCGKSISDNPFNAERNPTLHREWISGWRDRKQYADNLRPATGKP